MKINYKNAMKIWESYFGDAEVAEDFDGGLMYKEAYGDNQACEESDDGRIIHCGWNIHHILPKANGGTNVINNLICTNIITNEKAGDKTTFWIDDNHYQVQKDSYDGGYCIVKLN